MTFKMALEEMSQELYQNYMEQLNNDNTYKMVSKKSFR
jgi:hypothetical protein